ncbi:MAG: TonB-dependent receptor [Candidatus Acidiferrales bacterium]
MRVMDFLRVVGRLLMGALFLAPSALGQTGTATISGLVTDESGGLVVKAALELKSVDKGTLTTTTTNDTGIYVFTGIQPGQYQITIRKPGFKQVDFLGLVLNTQDHVEQNFRLQLGSISESVTVNGDAERMETDNPAVGLLVNRDFVENMPLNGRSFQDLIALAPGTVSSSFGYSVNGQRDDANNYSVDGVAANLSANFFAGGGTISAISAQLSGSLPAATALGTTQSLASVDALQEFRIETSGYAAEFGRQPGGQIQITTRSGANQFHGSAYDYFRNTDMDSNNYFANLAGQPREPERQNDFGGTLGGPVVVPGIYYGKNKTFFFVSFEGLRLALPQFIQEYDPTVAFRQSASPGIQPFLNALPIPNGAPNPDGVTALSSYGFSLPSNINATSVRIDHSFGEQFDVFGHLNDTSSNATAVTHVMSYPQTQNINMLALTLGATWRMRPNIVNELRFNYSKSGGSLSTSGMTIGGAVPFPIDLILPTQYSGGYTDTSASIFLQPSGTSLNEDFLLYFQPLRQRQYDVVDSLAWTRGQHTLKFGEEVRSLSPLYNGSGLYSTFLAFSSLTNTEQGIVDSYFVDENADTRPIFHNISLYVQDHWKVGARLTLDYGVRWEVNPAPGWANGNVALALTTSNLASADFAPAGTPLYHTRYSNFAPRVGFAWQPLKSRAIVLRGGVGVFYDTGQNATLTYNFAYATFNSYSDVPLPIPVADEVPPALPGSSGGGINSTDYFEAFLVDPHLKLPYTVQWNASVDVPLRPRDVLTVSYVGNAGRKLLYLGQYPNGLPNSALFASCFCQVTTNAASSSYNALQIQNQGYLTPGLQAIVSYTWAHALDDSTGDEFFDPSIYGLLRGNSDNDIRQVLNAGVNYELPEAHGDGIARALTHGWVFANRFQAQTGTPFNVSQGSYYLANGTTYSIQPNLVSGAPIYLHNVPGVPGGWELNRNAFSDVPVNAQGQPTEVGDLGRNFLHGPAFWNLNTAVQRTFSLTEGLRMIFRAEAFNLFNHPNFSGIDTSLTDATFGQALEQANVGVRNSLYATGSPRSLQLLLKLQF